MSLASLLTRTATIHHRTQTGAVDRYNEPTWETTTSTAPAYLEPLLGTSQTREVTVGRETQIGTHMVVLPAGTVVDGSDEVTIDGVTYEVLGPAGRFHDPEAAAEHHVQLIVREVTG